MNITEDFKQRLLQAAEKCPQAKETLKTLFPEVFESKYFDLIKNEYSCNSDYRNLFLCGDVQILVANGIAPNGMENKCFYLSEVCDWELKNFGSDKFLIPTRKK